MSDNPTEVKQSEEKSWTLSQADFQSLVDRQTNIESLLTQALAAASTQTPPPPVQDQTVQDQTKPTEPPVLEVEEPPAPEEQEPTRTRTRRRSFRLKRRKT